MVQGQDSRMHGMGGSRSKADMVDRFCERCRKGCKIVTCGEEAPDELCGDFEWTDGR